jgi:hypothetical protein
MQGPCIQCEFKSCLRAYHPLCAMRKDSGILTTVKRVKDSKEEVIAIFIVISYIYIHM